MFDTIIDPLVFANNNNNNNNERNTKNVTSSSTSSTTTTLIEGFNNNNKSLPSNIRYMETIMEPIAAKNCSYWGTYLYGHIGHPPTIQHLHGRTELNTTVFSK